MWRVWLEGQQVIVQEPRDRSKTSQTWRCVQRCGSVPRGADASRTIRKWCIWIRMISVIHLYGLWMVRRGTLPCRRCTLQKDLEEPGRIKVGSPSEMHQLLSFLICFRTTTLEIAHQAHHCVVQHEFQIKFVYRRNVDRSLFYIPPHGCQGQSPTKHQPGTEVGECHPKPVINWDSWM